VSAKFGFLLAFANRQVTAVWPPTGLAFTAYILFGPMVWPGIYAGALLANALSNEPLLTAAGVAVGNTVFGIAGLFVLRRFWGYRKTLESLRDVLGIIVIGGGLGCLISATNGVASLALAGIVPWSAFSSVWWVWWVGDAMGVLL